MESKGKRYAVMGVYRAGVLAGVLVEPTWHTATKAVEE